jgi:hypothetical protein
MNPRLTLETFKALVTTGLTINLFKMQLQQDLYGLPTFVLETIYAHKDNIARQKLLEIIPADPKDIDEVLNFLKENNYITMANDILALTSESKQLIEAMQIATIGLAESILQGISDTQKEQICALLKRIGENVESLAAQQDKQESDDDECCGKC